MKQKKITVQYGQTIYDIAIQEFGSVEGIFAIQDKNPEEITALSIPLAPGLKLTIDGTATDEKVLKFFKQNNIQPVSGDVAEAGLSFTHDFDCAEGGILTIRCTASDMLVRITMLPEAGGSYIIFEGSPTDHGDGTFRITCNPLPLPDGNYTIVLTQPETNEEYTRFDIAPACGFLAYDEMRLRFNFSKSDTDMDLTKLLLDADGMLVTGGYTVDWGDGTTDTSATHTYADAGEYSVYIQISPAGTVRAADLSSREITQIQLLPSGLRSLDFSTNAVSEMPELPNGLVALNFNSNIIADISGVSLPTSLLYLDGESNGFNALPALPANLVRLSFAGNNVSTIPDPLPTSLETLWCGFNPLTGLPALPSGLIELSCENAALPTLPALPSSLLRLYCSANTIGSIPSLPALLVLACQGCGLDTADINTILTTLESYSPTTGVYQLDSQSPSAPPTGAGATAKANLITAGNTVNTD